MVFIVFIAVAVWSFALLLALALCRAAARAEERERELQIGRALNRPRFGRTLTPVRSNEGAREPAADRDRDPVAFPRPRLVGHR